MINIRFYLKKYFKIFFYKIFSLIYGKVSYLKNNVNKDQLTITKVKRERKGINYKIFQIKNSRTYLFPCSKNIHGARSNLWPAQFFS